eukprot:357767-Chlamydomonas_euryale.AAC.7
MDVRMEGGLSRKESRAHPGTGMKVWNGQTDDWTGSVKAPHPPPQLCCQPVHACAVCGWVDVACRLLSPHSIPSHIHTCVDEPTCVWHGVASARSA